MKKQRNSKIAIYSGLLFMALAFICKFTGMPEYSFWTLLFISITLKTIFLVSLFRKGFKPNKGFYILITGVCMILLFMLFKYIYPIPLLSKILFFGAIFFKITGLIVMNVSKRS